MTIPNPYKKSLIVGGCAIGAILLGALVFSWVAGPDSTELMDTYLRYNPSSVQQRKTLLNCVNMRFNANGEFDNGCLLDHILKSLDRSQQSAFYTRCLAVTEPVTLQEISGLVQRRGIPQSEIDRYLENASSFAPDMLSWNDWLTMRAQCRHN